MPIELHLSRPVQDASAQELLRTLREKASELHLDGAIVYYGFPRFRTPEDELIAAQTTVLSPHHGLIIIGASSAGREAVAMAASEVDAVYGQILSKLVGNARLRRGGLQLSVSTRAYLYAPGSSAGQSVPGGVETIGSLSALEGRLRNTTGSLAQEVFEELVATVDGSKVLPRPKKRETADLPPGSKGGLVARLESELARFDDRQREGSHTAVTGPQRIRGLAGSGKTIVLAKKTALTHIDNPDAVIGYTFHTKSLYQQIRRLITRFYRDQHDRDPDWTRLRVLHTWGGADEGIYSLACRAHGIQPLKFTEAQRQDYANPFGYACQQLMKAVTIKPVFDYLFIDEGQDCPDAFLLLCSQLARDMKFVYAYDELQTIFQPNAPTPSSVFGVDKDGKPRVELERDIVLYRCYRNPREILVCAHAIGLGVYGKPVQMLENAEHWRDVGYIVRKGPLSPGINVEIERPLENSLPLLSTEQSISQLIQVRVYDTPAEEVAAAVAGIKADVADGLRPDDIVVAVADDRNAQAYLQSIANGLARDRIASNNIHSVYGLVDFQQDQRVTLTTVHKAKGNEGFMVYVLGADAEFMRPGRRSRNKLFTAMTRSKGWLRVSGVGTAAKDFQREVAIAAKNSPFLRFQYPSPAELDVMKRDLADTAVEEMGLERLLDEFSEQDIAAYLKKRRHHGKSKTKDL